MAGIAENNRRVMKRAGVATGIGICVIALITGFCLGLKRAGKDLDGQAKKEEAWTPIYTPW